jgi:MFS family permease
MESERVVGEAVTGEAEPKPGKIKLGTNYWRLWTASVISNLGDGVATIAYPWLASAVTRNGLLIGLVAVAQRLPWLVFTLPAGVITDRLDRRKIMVSMDMVRATVTIVVAFVVLARQGVLPAPAEIAAGLELTTDATLYTVLLLASLFFGFAEVLRDNAAQTILPAIVEPAGLEKANGQMWGVEMVANSFVGPPLGSLLIGIAFSLPFFFDALLKPMAIILGVMNGVGAITFATFVLFAQEILHTTAFQFALLGTGAAIGGLAGTFFASKVSSKLGSGASLLATLLANIFIPAVIGISSHWVVVWGVFGLFTFTAVLWNVITVSLRQTIIPDRLLGRVNSVYRFFAWGMMPIGSVVGGLLVVGTETVGSRELALRMPWFVAAAAYVFLLMYAAPKLTTEKIEAARAEGIAAKQAAN